VVKYWNLTKRITTCIFSEWLQDSTSPHIPIPTSITHQSFEAQHDCGSLVAKRGIQPFCRRDMVSGLWRRKHSPWLWASGASIIRHEVSLQLFRPPAHICRHVATSTLHDVSSNTIISNTTTPHSAVRLDAPYRTWGTVEPDRKTVFCPRVRRRTSTHT
jgi:hypothetical protein